jgi:alkylhydroperoxidase family enzyme
MNSRYEPLVQRLNQAILYGHGVTQPALRQAVESGAATLGGRSSKQGSEAPAALTQYIEKVARHAYKVTDADIEALQQAGYSEDAIFEITVSAALGAAMGRLERGLAALKGDFVSVAQQQE